MLEDDDDNDNVPFWSNAYQHLLAPTKKKSNVFKLCRCALQRRCFGARALRGGRLRMPQAFTSRGHCAAREVDPRAMTATGNLYGRGYIFCQPCWDTNKLKSPCLTSACGRPTLACTCHAEARGAPRV